MKELMEEGNKMTETVTQMRKNNMIIVCSVTAVNTKKFNAV